MYENTNADKVHFSQIPTKQQQTKNEKQINEFSKFQDQCENSLELLNNSTKAFRTQSAIITVTNAIFSLTLRAKS